eukprot:8641285-Alexandrium_andersonii.AAC.1
MQNEARGYTTGELGREAPLCTERLPQERCWQGGAWLGWVLGLQPDLPKGKNTPWPHATVGSKI